MRQHTLIGFIVWKASLGIELIYSKLKLAFWVRNCSVLHSTHLIYIDNISGIQKGRQSPTQPLANPVPKSKRGLF